MLVEVPIILMFLAGITGIGNIVADYERQQIYKMIEQRNEAISMKLINQEGDSENEKDNNNVDNHSFHRPVHLLALLWNRGIEMDRRSYNTAFHQVKELI
jgi:hypothetical protein